MKSRLRRVAGHSAGRRSSSSRIPRDSDHSIVDGAGDAVGNEQRAPSAISARQITGGLAVDLILDAMDRIR
jgi:hypothetical protein